MANKTGTAPANNRVSGLIAARTSPAQLEDEMSTPIVHAAESAPRPTPTRSKAEKPKKLAKSKDPDWGGFTIMLKIETQADAVHHLRKSRSGEDLSELTQRLLAAWVEKQKQ